MFKTIGSDTRDLIHLYDERYSLHSIHSYDIYLTLKYSAESMAKLVF